MSNFSPRGVAARYSAAFSGLLMAAFIAIAASSVLPTVQAQEIEEPETQVTLVAGQAKVAPGQSVDLALEFRVKPGWHLYWKNPGETGLAPTARWDAPAGVAVGDLAFPVPEEFSFAGFNNYGYTRDFTLLTQLTVAQSASAGPLRLDGALEWLACDDEICVPEDAQVDITVGVDAGAQGGNSDPAFARAVADLPLQTQWAAQANIDKGQFVLDVAVPFTQSDVGQIAFFPETQGLIVYEAPQVITWTNDGHVRIEVDARGSDVPAQMVGLLKVSPVADGPARGYDLKITPSTMLTADDSAAVAPGNAGAQGEPTGKLNSFTSAPQALLAAVLGGLLLNLMPCVFPVLSLKALALTNGHHGADGFRREGWFYTLGILVSFLVLGGSVLGLKAAGSAIGWGFQLQSPVVIASLALVMFIIALNLFGVFEFSGRFAGAGQSWLAGKSESAQSFFTGVLAAVVATPCTAPFMAGALAFAFTQPAPVAMGIFLSLGLGLALPFLLLAYSPWLQRHLPKPGAWMETFKQLLAFPMLATCLWLLWTLSGQGGSEAVLLVLGVAMLIVFAGWAWGRGGDFSARIYKVAALGAVIVGALGISQIDYSARLQAAVPSTLNAEPFSQARLDTLVDEGGPVFVYFTADWCITCKVNERLALKTDKVASAFAANGVKVLEADWTRRDDEIARVLARFGRAGVPLYLYYDGTSASPVELPQLLRPEAILKVIAS